MKQMYVTLKEHNRHDYVDGKYELVGTSIEGFASGYDQTSDRQIKRNKNQDSWAYGNHEVDGGVYVRAVSSYERNPILGSAYIQVVTKTPVKQNLQPKIFDCQPMSGFKIASTRSRSSTSNKFWLITDPRGFDVEISTNNMEEALADGIVDHGIFVGEYIWTFGKSGIGKSHLTKV